MEGSACESGRERLVNAFSVIVCDPVWNSQSSKKKGTVWERMSGVCVYECKCMRGCGGSTALRSKWSGRPHHTEFYYHLLIHMLISLAMTCTSPAKKEHKITTPTRAYGLLPQQTENLYKLIMQPYRSNCNDSEVESKHTMLEQWILHEKNISTATV